MTQLPEVEVLRKDLEKEVVGKRVKEVWVSPAELVRRHGTIKDFAATLTERKLLGVSRRGVVLLLQLDEDLVLVIVMGRRARITRETASADKGTYTRMIASFTTGGSMHYHDLDADGSMFIVPTAEVDDLEELSGLGLDPLNDTIPWPELAQRVVAQEIPLGKLFRDPSFVAGLGDVYADEILFEAGLSPKRSSTTLSNQEMRRLQRAILEVLYEAVKQGGVDQPRSEGDDTFVPYEEIEFLKIHGRAGEPDARSREPIVCEDIGDGVRAYFSPRTQT